MAGNPVKLKKIPEMPFKLRNWGGNLLNSEKMTQAPFKFKKCREKPLNLKNWRDKPLKLRK